MKKWKVAIVAIVAYSLFFLSACSTTVETNQKIQVTLLDSFGVKAQNHIQMIQSGDDVEFLLKTENGFAITGCDYHEFQLSENADGYLTLTLYDVKYPTRVSLDVTGRFCTIAYDANGGERLDGKIGQYVSKYSLETHLRPNTARGTLIFSREGYTLIGWNTEADGSGTQIGLGSRVTVSSDSMTLYAVWKKESEPENFEYHISKGEIAITGYHGTDEPLVIPSKIEECPVTSIESDAFTNVASSEVILPPTIKRISQNAFVDCDFTTLYLFNTVSALYTESFVNCRNFSTARINAERLPCGYNLRRESVYADKADLLILAAGKKKMVFFGGCSIWYNLNGKLMYDAFNGEYAVINMGLNGVVNGGFQADILYALMEPNDILVHVPEANSYQQLMTRTEFHANDKKIWCGIEMNYDLFSLVDIRNYPGVLQNFSEYFDATDPRCQYSETYQDSEGHYFIDEFGCASFERNQAKESLADTAGLDPTYIPQAGSEHENALSSVYEKFARRDITVFVSLAAVNKDSLPDSQKSLENITAYEEMFRRYAEKGGYATVISSLSDSLLGEDCFYDSNYHLLTSETNKYTERLIVDIMQGMAA